MVSQTVDSTDGITFNPWLTATIETSTQFIGQQDEGDAGIAYTFRVQATDNVGNVSGWVESASTTVDAVTKYYHYGGSRVAIHNVPHLATFRR